MLALSSFAFAASATAETSKLIIESGDSAQSRQNAAMDKEQWNDTRNLRQKVNKRAEKEWDKEDVAFDARDKCQQSATSMPTGSLTPCAAWIAALAARCTFNVGHM
jgi:hypothetical protein